MGHILKSFSTLGLTVISLTVVLATTSFAPATMAARAVERLTSAPSISDGRCTQPPNNVDHATFTDAQLDLYGLPHRAPGESLEVWQQMVRAAKHRVCGGTVTNISHGKLSGSRGAATANEQLNDWAGNIAWGGGYSEGVGLWNVPCLTLLLHDGVASTWVGLGGDGLDGGGNLVQSGTISQEYSDFPGHWTAQYYAFIEDYPYDPKVINVFPVNCGDPMYADDWQDYSNGQPVDAQMYIEDGRSGSYKDAVNRSAFSNGSTAEWIIERANTNFGWNSNNLADFNAVNFTDCYAVQDGLVYDILSLPHDYSTMYYNGHDLVAVGPLYYDGSDNGDHFSMTWLHSH